jgi:excisionase family DNA binding protein
MSYLTVEEVAKQFHTTPDHIRKKAAAGSIPAFKPGRRWLFHPELIDKYSRGEWHSTKEQPGVPGGLDSQYAVRLFAEAPEHSTAKRPKNSRPRSATATGGRRN